MNHIVTAVGVTIASGALILFLDYKMRSYTRKLNKLEARCQSIRDRWQLLKRIHNRINVNDPRGNVWNVFNVERQGLEAEMAEIEGQL